MPNNSPLLSKTEILKWLVENGFKKPLKLHLFSSIDSTNTYLKTLPISTEIEICCSETQTQGRGRLGRTWHSPSEENIYCSGRWRVKDLNKVSALSLVCSLAVIDVLKEFDITDLKIKWPNDILWNDKKLCGNLVELISENKNEYLAVIGIGLNVNSDTLKHSLPDKEWCSLYEITGIHHNRNQLISAIVCKLDSYLDKLWTYGFSIFLNEWEKYDYLKNNILEVKHHQTTIKGKACGITEQGNLILELENGARLNLNAGEVSLKK